MHSSLNVTHNALAHNATTTAAEKSHDWLDGNTYFGYKNAHRIEVTPLDSPVDSPTFATGVRKHVAC